jgi:hypothetical protein
MPIPTPDWSKAPPGATHYSLVKEIGSRWLKAEKGEDGRYYYYFARYGGGWLSYGRHHSVTLHHFSNAIVSDTFKDEDFLPWEEVARGVLLEYVRDRGYEE